MAEAGEREQQVEPAAPASTGAAPALAGGVSDSALAGAGQSRPPLNRGTVMRLQNTAGNAAVSGLVSGRRGDSAVRTVTLPAPGDAALMRAMVARAPAEAPVVDEQRDAAASEDKTSSVNGILGAPKRALAGGEKTEGSAPGDGLAGAFSHDEAAADTAADILGPAQRAFSPGQAAANTAADILGPAQRALSPSQTAANTAADILGPAQRAFSPGQGAGGWEAAGTGAASAATGAATSASAGTVAPGAATSGPGTGDGPGPATSAPETGAAAAVTTPAASAAAPALDPAALATSAAGLASGAAGPAAPAVGAAAAALGAAAPALNLTGLAPAEAGSTPGAAALIPGAASVPGAAGAGAPALDPVALASGAAGPAPGAAAPAMDPAAPVPGAAAPAAGVDAVAGAAAAAGPGVDVAGGAADIAGALGAGGGPMSVLGSSGAMGGMGAAISGGLNAAGPAAAGPAAPTAGGGPDLGGAEAAGGEADGGGAKEGPSEEELAEIEAELAAGPQREEEPEPMAAAPEPVIAPEPESATAETAEAEVDPGPEPSEEAALVSTAGSPDAAPAAIPEVAGLDAGPASAEELQAEQAPEPDAGGGGDSEIFIARAPATEVLEPPTEDLTAESDEEPAADPGAISAEAQGEMEALGAGGGEYAGGGGGGGGGAVEAEPEQPAPDVSNADPAAAVAQAASLKPTQMLETLGGAEKAAANHVTKEHEKLAAQPPELEAGGGADGPAADEKHASTPPTRPTTTKAAAKSGGEPEKPAPTPAPPPKAPLPAGPALTPDEKGNVSEGDGAKIKAAIDALPTSDGAVVVPPISTPKLTLSGAADPGQMAEQKQHLDETVGKASAQGAKEAAEPAGENDLAPTVKAEKIKAEIPAGGAAAAAGAAGPGADDDTASIVAEQESGPQLKAAAAQASAQIDAEKGQHASKAAQTKAAAVEEAQAEEAKGKADQIAEHAATKAGVSSARQDWTGEQKQQADAAKLEATGAVGEAHTAIQGEKTRAESEAIKHVESGRKEAEDQKRKGDEEAKREKDKAKEDSGGGGFFGWVASKAKALYDKVKDGITAVFNKVRSAITTAINKAKELAHSVIDRAVKFVADKVTAVAGKLLAIGDKLIPGFAAARQKFGKWIKDRVKQAVTALNKIVTAVKDGIRKVMSAVGNALKAGLDLLRKGISAAIDAVKNVVKAAIEKAKAAIAALGQFASIIKDIASNPGQWLSNLGAAVVDGIKNHLWKALKTAVQTWFNEKLESLLGLGKSVLSLLTKGGISMAQVGKMAFEALKAAIPPALIALLVERLVSMIVPAAGAVMAVVQGLMAAWGAIQKILAAIDRFIAFLKAIKSGGAGPAFASALAAAAVAVIEFVSQFLLRKIAGAASKVAGKIKAIAQKIGKKLMAGLKKVGKKLKRGATRLKDKVFGKKKKTDPDKKDKDKKKDEKEDKQKRLDDAVRAIRPKILSLVAKKASSLRMKAQLLYWKVAHKLSRLWVERKGDRLDVQAQVNPTAAVVNDVFSPTELHALLQRVGDAVLKKTSVQQVAQIKADQQAGIGKPGQSVRDAQSPAAEITAMNQLPVRGTARTGEHIDMGGQTVKEQFQYQTSAAGTTVNIPGTGNKGDYDPYIADAMDKIEALGIPGTTVREGVHNLLQGKPLPAAIAQHPMAASQIASVTRLMFVVEPARASHAMATSFMAFESAGQPGTHLSDTATTWNPMSADKALTHNRSAHAEAERLSQIPPGKEPRDSKKRRNMDAFLRAQADAVARYLQTLMKAEQPMFTDEASCRVWLEKEFEQHLIDKLEKLML